MADTELGAACIKNIKKSYNLSSGSKEMNAFYDEWANDYEDSGKAIKYVGPEIGAKTLVQFLEKLKIGPSCKILDVGSGIGLVGEQLRELNYTNVDALEPSDGSNDVARSKGLYKKFIVEKLDPDKQVSIPSDTYDAAICIGVLIPGHVKTEGIDEMLRVVKSGGLVSFSIREDLMGDEDYGYDKKMAELCAKNAWKLLSKNKEPYTVQYGCYIFVYQVL